MITRTKNYPANNKLSIDLSKQTLIALWKANVPHWVWIGSPLWIGAIALGLDGRNPNWTSLVLFVLTVLTIQCIAEFANSYTDRNEDRLYGPTNTLVTGELRATTAKKVLVFQNAIAIALLSSLLLLTHNYALIGIVAAGWFFSMAYSVPPFRLKETIFGPFAHAIAFALLPIAGWLIVEPSLTAQNGFMLAFASLVFLHSFAIGIMLKFRKTFLALDSGLIKIKPGSNLHNLRIVGLTLKYKTAIRLEEITAIGTFILVPIFWHQGIFSAALSIGLLAGPLTLTVLAIMLRIKHPVDNSARYKALMTLAWILIVVLLLGVGLSQLIHWSFAATACLIFLLGFPFLVRIVHPWGSKSLNGRY